MTSSSLRVFQYRNPTQFLAKAETWLKLRECEHGRILALALDEKATGDQSSLFLAVEQAGQLVGSAALTKDGTLDVGVTSLAGAGLLKLIFDQFQGRVERVITFPLADLVPPLDSFTKKHTMCLYDCHRVSPTGPIQGRFRPATLQDLDCLADWWKAFHAELSLPVLSNNARTVISKHIKQHTAFVWEDDSLVSMACCGRSTGNGIAIFSVYTPPKRRGKGFGTACTAALTEQLLNSSCQFCCLFADDANPVTNHIYQKIGYQFVGKTQLWAKPSFRSS